MIKIETARLEGSALDWAVSSSIGEHDDGDHATMEIGLGRYSPSTDWSQGGPLIERHDVWISSDAIPGPWLASINGCGLETGPTPLIAACRAIVYDKLGDTVDVPADLVEPNK